MEDALKSLILQRVEAVDSLLLKEPEYEKREMLLSKIEKILCDAGDVSTFQELKAAFQEFEYRLGSNVYLQSIKDQKEIRSLSMI